MLFGIPAAKAIPEYQEWRPSRSGFLFEATNRGLGSLSVTGGSWYVWFYVNGVQRKISLSADDRDRPRDKDGRRFVRRDLLTPEQAKERFEKLAGEIGWRSALAHPYNSTAIRALLNRLALRAKIGKVHPHALPRAFASHLLQGGASIRVVQDLLGHENLSTTAIYLSLTAEHLKVVHEKCHPHEHGADHAEEEALGVRMIPGREGVQVSQKRRKR